MPSRRTLLVGAIAALAPGCLGADHRCTDEVEIEAERLALDAYLVTGPDGDGRGSTDVTATLARRVAEAGSFSVTTFGSVPDLDGERVEESGTYYRIDRTDRSFTPVDALEVTVEESCATAVSPAGGSADRSTGTTRAAGRTLAEADLPAVDRRALRRAIEGGDDADPSVRSCGDLRGTDALFYPDGLGASRLADLERVRIEWGDRTYRLRVRGEGIGRRYATRYEATAVAADDDEFRALIVAEEDVTALDGLTDAERTAMDDAVGGVLRACLADESSAAGVRGLLDELDTVDPTRVAYDDRLYEVTVRRRVAEL